MGSVHPLKRFIYHHKLTTKLYNIYRNYNRDKRNKMSDEDFAHWRHIFRTGRDLDLDNPRTFNEKIWWLKLYDRNPLKTICTDKYRLQEYVKECGLGHICNEIYGVYDSFDEIPFDELPDRFYIKRNHTSGCNIIYDRSKPFDFVYYKNEFDFWMQRNYFWGSREYNYKDIVPKIICEKVLEDKEGNLPADYKVMCFHGEAKLMFLGNNLAGKDGAHSGCGYCDVFDRDFNWIPILDERPHYTEKPIEKPDNYETMFQYAEILGKPFRHVRVDFYDVDGKIYIGEMTFNHGGGCQDLQPEEWALKMGDWISLDGIERIKQE